MLQIMDSSYRLDDVPNETLLVNLKRLTGRANELTAQLLAHLAEVDARGIHRQWACATVFIYCVYELRMSEDEAQRRCRAARVARQFPVLFNMLADASIHLTGILLLAPHLTAGNHAELLARARYRTKRELEKLIAEIAPYSDVPAVIQPLGRGLAAPTRCNGISWANRVRAHEGPVRHLTPGNGPQQAPMGDRAQEHLADAGPETPDAPEHGQSAAPADGQLETAPADGQLETTPSHPTWGPPLVGLRYKIQFTADQTYVDQLEQARDLLAHQLPDRDLARVQQLAIEALLEKLGKRRYAATKTGLSKTRETTTTAPTQTPAPTTAINPTNTRPTDTPRQTHSLQHSATPRAYAPAVAPPEDTKTSRHIPAAVKRAVWERDAGRCAYVDARGQRCHEAARLEFHHRTPYAQGGPTTVENLALHCQSHNTLAAEQDYGPDVMDRKKSKEPGHGDAAEPSQRLSDAWTQQRAIRNYQTRTGTAGQSSDSRPRHVSTRPSRRCPSPHHSTECDVPRQRGAGHLRFNLRAGAADRNHTHSRPPIPCVDSLQPATLLR